MALNNRSDSINYVRVKEGKFYIGKDLDTPYDSLEGKITSLSYKDETYEGITQRKLIVVVTDDKDYQLSINTETSTYGSFVSFLGTCNLSKDVRISPKAEKITGDREYTRTTLFVSNIGEKVKPYFTKDNQHGAPSWNKVKVGKKEIVDKSEWLEFMETFVLKKLAVNLDKKSVNTDDLETEQEQTSSKLPWE